MFAVTGATGKLGRLVVDQLLQRVPASQIVAAVRNPSKAQDLAALGVQVREADYARPETLTAALRGVKKLLLISASEPGERLALHSKVIEAAKRTGVEHLAYTSILRAETSTLLIAKDHRETEHVLRSSGLQHSFLRNGWYIENYTEQLAGPLASGVLSGSAKTGRIAAATRLDYAAAAAAVLTAPTPKQSYELAGDEPFTLAQLAAELTRASGKTITYQDLPASAYREQLIGFGVPAGFAEMLVDADVGITRGELDDDTHTLSQLIGRPTTPLAAAVKQAFPA